MKHTLTPHERRLCIATSLLLALGVLGHLLYPITPDIAKQLMASLGLPANMGGHHFVDSRAGFGIPNAMDVLSNMPFAFFGVWGLWRLRSIHAPHKRFMGRENFVLSLFFVGLLFTTIGSCLYHLAPTDATLLWDRAGMAFAFAGMLGIAASERVSVRSGIWLGLLTLLCGAIALFVWSRSADVLPWSVVQFGGMAMILILSITRPIPKALGISLLWVVVFYAVAKIFEAFDHGVYEATGHMVSGHTLKHLVAALAALPIIRVLK